MNDISAWTRELPSGSRPSDALLSIVIPMRNEALGIDALFERLLPILGGLDMRTEVICVDDGSTDETLYILDEQRRRNRQIKVVSLSRNFGKEIALAAGMSYARGDAVVLMDADLQHPPELIESFVSLWRQGYDMVYGIRRKWRRPTTMNRIAAAAFYRAFAAMAQTELPPGAGDFRLLDRRVVEALNACSERNRFTKGLYSWVGFRQIGVPFTVGKRASGRSGWSSFGLWRFAVDAITSFSMMPLRVWSYVGVIVSLLSLSYGGFIVVRTLIYGRDVPGYASLIAAITFFAGIQLIGLGVIGEYLGRVFTEVKRRPLFIVARELGFDAAADADVHADAIARVADETDKVSS